MFEALQVPKIEGKGFEINTNMRRQRRDFPAARTMSTAMASAIEAICTVLFTKLREEEDTSSIIEN
ncbi:putative chaperon-like protein Ycf39 for quinone binding in Photosystem [Sesbania bispinosa]|nr:putative chaperon-like protein Ycf39 for quinone binding in Photosystem [Sesbania bispinosa]